MQQGEEKPKTMALFFTCFFSAVTWLGRKERCFFDKCYAPHVLRERYKGAWRGSTPVLVLAVGVLFKTSKAHQGRLSVLLQECQAFRCSPRGKQSLLLLFGHLSHLHVNKCGGLGRVYLCARWMCWCVMCTNKVQPSRHSPLQPHWIPPRCGTECVLSCSLERQLLLEIMLKWSWE